ncbi:hypothetical protein DPMN_072732 [Dreissena polymorpha]|uniref:Uncharacterized protein n=1 Tax=Dreissena polymorpha TaxID=45954 RepID=A0A9D4BXT7_DREPO|nr:hypothetical protein DPMN_072732 [Dreissena polymorpha]
MERQMTYIDPVIGAQNCSKLCTEFPKGCAQYCKGYIQPEVNLSKLLSVTSTIPTSPMEPYGPPPYIIIIIAAAFFLVIVYVIVCCFKDKIKSSIEKIRKRLGEKHLKFPIQETAQTVVLIPLQDEANQAGNNGALFQEPAASLLDDTEESNLSAL